MSSRCSSRVISKYGIFFLLREVILYSVASSRGCCGAHSFPDLATSSAFFKNGSLSNVLKAPSKWSTTVFTSFSLRNIHYMFEGVRSLGLGCSRRTFSVIVLSTCPLYPRDETAYHH